jgi:hypothetical protein
MNLGTSAPPQHGPRCVSTDPCRNTKDSVPNRGPDEMIGHVSRGQVIANVGSYGCLNRATDTRIAPHLHFEVRHCDHTSGKINVASCKVVDPYGWIWPTVDPFEWKIP